MRTELDWQPDILGSPYEAATLELPADDEGDVVATLVRLRADQPTRAAVLYVHGFCDYFFQTHAAEYWTSQGYDFYAIDLQKYGRSLRPHQTPNYVASLSDYYAELDLAWAAITAEHDHVVVSAHSTGGLTVPLWLHDRKIQPAAVVLNSPWFELMGSDAVRIIATPIVRRVGAIKPKAVFRGSSDDLSFYGKSIHREFGGEWDYDLAWKPLSSFPVTFGWLRAIRAGHARIGGGVDVQAPILVLASSKSCAPKAEDDPRIHNHDIVIDVRQTRERSTKLGKHVSMVSLDGALHDVTLSAAPVRARVFSEITKFLNAYAPLDLSVG